MNNIYAVLNFNTLKEVKVILAEYESTFQRVEEDVNGLLCCGTERQNQTNVSRKEAFIIY